MNIIEMTIRTRKMLAEAFLKAGKPELARIQLKLSKAEYESFNEQRKVA